MPVLLLLLATGWGASLALPPGEHAPDWAAALDVAGLSAGPGGVVIEVGSAWRLTYASESGVRTATVAPPRSAEEREQVAILAASLMRRGQSRVLPGTGRTAVVPAPVEAPPVRRPAGRVVASVRPVATVEEPAALPVADAVDEAVAEAVVPRRFDAPPEGARPGGDVVAAAMEAAPAVPVATGSEAVVIGALPAERVPYRVEMSVSAAAMGLLRPGLGSNAGGSLAARAALGPWWLEAEGRLYAPTEFEAGTLGLAALSLHGGGRVELGEGWGSFGGVGMAAQRWEVVDLAGSRAAAGFGLEALVGMDRVLWGPVALELNVRGGWDAQGLQIDALAEPPSRWSAGVGLGLRVGA